MVSLKIGTYFVLITSLLFKISALLKNGLFWGKKVESDKNNFPHNSSGLTFHFPSVWPHTVSLSVRVRVCMGVQERECVCACVLACNVFSN